jgi:PAS domain S-box-containing protein
VSETETAAAHDRDHHEIVGLGASTAGADALRTVAAQLRELSEQIERLGATSNEGGDPDELPELLAGLRTALAQLRNAQDELDRRNEALAASQVAIDAERRLYADLFELAPDAYLVTDANGIVLDSNAAATQLLRRARRFLVGKPLAVVLAPKSRRSFRQALAAGGREDVTLELTLDVHDAPTMIVSATVAVRSDHDVRTMLWILRDVTTDRARELELRIVSKELESRVQARTRELEAVLDHLPVGTVLIQAATGRVVRANPRALELSGLSRDSPPIEDVDLDLYAVEGAPLDRDRWPAMQALRGETVVADVVRRVQADGSELTLEISAAPVMVGGRVEAAVVVFHDVTDRERKESAVRGFVANAAHEIGTPLAGILAAVEALQAGAKNVPADRDRFLDHVESESLRLSRLTRALLVLARAQARDEAAPLEIVPLAALLSDVAGSVTPAPDVRVEVACPLDAAAVANRPLLEQALVNLAGNAARYTVVGEIRLSARSEDGFVELTVADTGPGIPHEIRDRLFERFVRSADRAGFGLGLAIAHDSVKATHGTLSIDSEPGVGTRAVVRLPAARLVEDA